MPKTREQLGLSDARAQEPDEAIDGMVYWYRKILDENHGDHVKALQNYFCGKNTKRRRCIGSPKGLEYVRKVANAPSRPAVLAMVRGEKARG